MTREQILEERCEKLKSMLKDTLGYEFASIAGARVVAGKLTINDFRYLFDLDEISE